MAARRDLRGSDPRTEALREELLTLSFDADQEHSRAAVASLKAPKLTPALTPALGAELKKIHWGGRVRTSNLLVNSQALCRLSYTPSFR